MRDEYDDRLHQALRHDFASNIGDIVKSIAHAFDRLHERLYGAPWSQRTRPGRSGVQGQPVDDALTTSC